ncbi:unnamed protein product [Linum trigynum]|uniref:CCHC-type domain-containing protein n=1 Tax=Linum trigynum TaxID=586398 RepID=A0AAV2E0W8_9ROSI
MIVWVQLPALQVHFYHKEKVEYENLPAVCFDCGKIGHNADKCPRLYPTSQPGQLAIVEVSAAASIEMATPEPSAGYGPWMLVSRKSRRNSREISQKRKEEVEVGKHIGGIGDKNGKEEARKGKGKMYGVSLPVEEVLGPGPSSAPSPQVLSGPITSKNQANTPHVTLLGDIPVGPNMNIHLAQSSNKEQPGIGPAVHKVIGPNGTNIQIVELRSSTSTLTHEQLSTAVEARKGKGKQSRNSNPRSRKCTPVKMNPLKLLQTRSPMKEKKSKSKARLAFLTLQDIKKWTSVGKNKTTVEMDEVLPNVEEGAPGLQNGEGGLQAST